MKATLAFLAASALAGDPAEELRRVLWERRAPDGAVHGADALDPLLWTWTQGLLEAPWHDEARAALDAFLAAGDEAVPDEPLRRALLQRDLLAPFVWLARRSQEPERAERALELAAPLARAIGRLALPAEEIDRLPDTLAAALAAPDGAGEDDLLPRDLGDVEGTWVELVGVRSDSVAPAHGHFAGPRSTFRVLVALPGGRAATEAWLERVAGAGSTGAEAARHLPPAAQVPAGARFALVRRAVLVDDRGQPRESPLAESLQVRRYVEEAEERPFPELSGQRVLELELDRASLLAGGAGLRALGPDDVRTSTFMTHGLDPFEWRGGAELERTPQAALQTCGRCHSGRGLFSVPTLSGLAAGIEPWRPPPVRARAAGAPRDPRPAHALTSFELGLLRGLARER